VPVLVPVYGRVVPAGSTATKRIFALALLFRRPLERRPCRRTRLRLLPGFSIDDEAETVR